MFDAASDETQINDCRFHVTDLCRDRLGEIDALCCALLFAHEAGF